MGPAYFIIAILGCGEADATCDEVGRTEASYQSIAACTAATEGAMEQHNDIPYPVVVAQCRPGNTSSLKLMSHDVKLPEPQNGARTKLNFAANAPR
jgi:hypothetical protein